jgi:hypothetical protein
MKRSSVIVTGIAVSPPVPVNTNVTPVNIGIGCIVSAAATVDYKVQHTFDDVFSPTFVAASATWFDHSTITGKTANFDGAYTTPIVAFRLNVSASDGTVTMSYVQAGI